MNFVSNDLRHLHSPSYLVEQVYNKAKQTEKNTIIESIRAVGEITALRQMGNFCLLSVDADTQIRYGRIVQRGNESDHVSYEKFLFDEQREMTSIAPHKQNIA